MGKHPNKWLAPMYKCRVNAPTIYHLLAIKYTKKKSTIINLPFVGKSGKKIQLLFTNGKYCQQINTFQNMISMMAPASGSDLPWKIALRSLDGTGGIGLSSMVERTLFHHVYNVSLYNVII